MAIAEGDEGEVGIMLSGHLFPLLLDAVQVGSKRRAEDSLGSASSSGPESSHSRTSSANTTT
jgi:hypothetical protein